MFIPKAMKASSGTEVLFFAAVLSSAGGTSLLIRHETDRREGLLKALNQTQAIPPANASDGLKGSVERKDSTKQCERRYCCCRRCSSAAASARSLDCVRPVARSELHVHALRGECAALAAGQWRYRRWLGGVLSVLVDPRGRRPTPPGIYEAGAGADGRGGYLARMVAAKPQVILITQSWQDFTCTRRRCGPQGGAPCGSFLVLAPPSGRSSCGPYSRTLRSAREGNRRGWLLGVRVLRPGESICEADGDGDGGLRRLLPEGMLRCSFTATEGSLVGPPWSARENGYLCRWASGCGGSGASVGGSVYTEPHSDLRRRNGSLRPKGADGDEAVDIVIAPVVKRRCGPTPRAPPQVMYRWRRRWRWCRCRWWRWGWMTWRFTLVHGGERALLWRRRSARPPLPRERRHRGHRPPAPFVKAISPQRRPPSSRAAGSPPSKSAPEARRPLRAEISSGRRSEIRQ